MLNQPDVPQQLNLHPVYVTYRVLPPEAWPARVRRRKGVTLFALDPRATRRQILEYLVDHWRPVEELALRLAWGQPLVGAMSDWLTEDEPAVLYVPPAVRMWHEPALQGGDVLRERLRAGLLEHEHRALLAERFARLSGSVDVPYLSNLELA